MPNKQTGAPVWSSVAIDAATNTVFATTGNPGSGTTTGQPLSNSVVALDATTLAVKDHWQIPASGEVPDSDFGATPFLYDVNGVSYIGALNKNGVFYVLNRNNLSGGYLWRHVVSGNSQLVQGDNVTSACYNNGVLYTPSTDGSIWAFTLKNAYAHCCFSSSGIPSRLTRSIMLAMVRRPSGSMGRSLLPKPALIRAAHKLTRSSPAIHYPLSLRCLVSSTRTM